MAARSPGRERPSEGRLGVVEFLGIARLSGQLPRSTRILGVEPLLTTTCGLELSEAVQRALRQVLAELVRELERLGVTVTGKQALQSSHPIPRGSV